MIDLARTGVGKLSKRTDMVRRSPETCTPLTIWCREKEVQDDATITAVARGIITKFLLKWGRDNGRRGKVITGPTDDADEQVCEPPPMALDPVDVERALMELNPGEGPSNDKTRVLLVMLAVGDTYEEIAQKTGQSEVAVRKSAERARKWAASRPRIRELLIAVGCVVGGISLVLVGSPDSRVMVQQTVTAWIRPPKPVDSAPKELSPVPEVGREVDRRIEDAEDALRKGDIERCNRDTEAAAFLGGGDPVRLAEVTRKCLEAGERNVVPAPSASAVPSASAAPSSRRKAPTPPPRRRAPVPDDDLRSAQPRR